MEPDAGAAALGIDDAVRADSQFAVGKPDVAPPVVPGSEPFGGRFKYVSQGRRPEAGKQFGVLAVDDELESDRHRAPPSAWQCPGRWMSGEAKAVLGQVVFDDPKGFGAHAMEFGQFCAGETRELTQGCVARVVQGAVRWCAD